MTTESNYAIATLSGWLKTLVPVFLANYEKPKQNQSHLACAIFTAL